MNEDRRSFRSPDPRRIAEFAATGRRLEHERARAAGKLQRLLRETPRKEWPWLARNAELHDCGALEELSAEIDRRLDASPREALVLAELATVIADSLPEDAYPSVLLAQIRATAWKDRGQALAYLARYDEAFAALDTAEAYVAMFGTLAHDVAIVSLVRATVLQQVGRFDESVELLPQCGRTFVAHGDLRRALICGVAEGVLLWRMQRYHESRELQRRLLANHGALADDKSLAAIHQGIAQCSIALRDFAVAEHHLAEAMRLYLQLRLPLQVLGIEAFIGTMLARKGEHAAAIRQLQRVRDEFLREGLVEEAGIVGLDVVETFLAEGAADEAEALAGVILKEFTAANLNARAITALGYLTEAIATRKASREAVTNVREYVFSLRTTPEREFTALA